MKQNTSTLSRRSALMGVSAIAVSAASSTAIANSATNPDAELLTLGTQLDQILAEWVAKRAIDTRNAAEWEAKCKSLSIPVLDWQELAKLPDHESDEKFKNHLSALKDHMPKDDDLDEHGASRTWTSIHNRLYPLCDDILWRRATSAEGLGVQARAASLYFEELWNSFGSDDEDIAVAQRSFIESVCTFSGVVPVPVEEAMLAGSPAPSRTLKAPEPDPIFAAIERHKTSVTAYLDAADAEDKLETAEPWYPEARADLDRAGDETNEAVSALINTAPTTIAGAVALLRHVSEYDQEGGGHAYSDDEGFNRTWTYWICDSAAATIEKLAVAS